MMFRAVVIGSLLGCVAAPAAAQSSPANRPEPGTATLISTMATVGPMAFAVAGADSRGMSATVAFTVLFWGGAVVGPATGYWYGHAGDRAKRGLRTRLITFAVASIIAPSDDLDDGIYPNPDLDTYGVPAWLTAAAIIGVSDIISIASVHGAVNKTRTALVTPVVDPARRRIGVAGQVRW